jgi:hypothetical protein
MDVSITPVGKSAFEDALKYSIKTTSHIQSHGGFSHDGFNTG